MGDKLYVGVIFHKLYDGLGGGEVETLGHTHAKLARTLGVELRDDLAKVLISGAIVVAMPRKGYYLILSVHAAKILKKA